MKCEISTNTHVFTMLGVLQAVRQSIPRFDLIHWAISCSSPGDGTAGVSLDLVYSGYEVSVDIVHTGYRVVGSYVTCQQLASANCETPSDVADVVRDMFSEWPALFVCRSEYVVRTLERMLADLIRAHGNVVASDRSLDAHMIRSLRILVTSWRNKLGRDDPSSDGST